MSWWKYKSPFELKWQEPYVFSLHLSSQIEKHTRWWVRPVHGLIFTALLMLPGKRALSLGHVLLVTGLAGFGLAYLIALMTHFSPRTIGFGEKAIIIFRGSSSRDWGYEHMHAVRFEKTPFREKDFTVMMITMVNSQQTIAAIADKMDVSEVSRFLESKGVKIEK